MKKSTFDKLGAALAIPLILIVAILLIAGIVGSVYSIQGGGTQGSIPQPVLLLILVPAGVSIVLILALSIVWLVKKSDESADDYRKRLKKLVRRKGTLQFITFVLLTAAFYGITYLILRGIDKTWVEINKSWVGLVCLLGIFLSSEILSRLIVKKFWKE